MTASNRDGEHMGEWTTSDGRVDVAAVMAGIRKKIRGRRDLGLHTDEEVDEIVALKLQAFADDAGIDPELLARLMADNHNWNISTDYRVETHRQGLGARAIVCALALPSLAAAQIQTLRFDDDFVAQHVACHASDAAMGDPACWKAMPLASPPPLALSLGATHQPIGRLGDRLR